MAGNIKMGCAAVPELIINQMQIYVATTSFSINRETFYSGLSLFCFSSVVSDAGGRRLDIIEFVSVYSITSVNFNNHTLQLGWACLITCLPYFSFLLCFDKRPKACAGLKIIVFSPLWINSL